MNWIAVDQQQKKCNKKTLQLLLIMQREIKQEFYKLRRLGHDEISQPIGISRTSK